MSEAAPMTNAVRPPRAPAPWRRWSEDEVATLKAQAGRMTAAEIGARVGRGEDQVRAKARAMGVSLVPGPALRARIDAVRAAGARAAWRDPVKAERMRAAMAARAPAGAAVAGCVRRAAAPGARGPRPRRMLPSPASMAPTAQRLRFAGWFVAAGWPAGEAAGLFGLSARDLACVSGDRR